MADVIGAGALRLDEEDQLVAEVLADREPPPRPADPMPAARPLAVDQAERVAGIAAGLCLLFGLTTAVAVAALPGADNAAVVGGERDRDRDSIELRFFGAWPASLDDSQLTAIIAHELGHVAAHHPASRFGQAKRVAASLWLPIDRRYSWATELTADRFALCGSAATPETLVSLAGHGGVAHPALDVRLRAARLFAASDRYRAITGRGSGELPIDVVDHAIAAMLPDAERSIYRLDGVDVLDTPRWLERRWQRRRDDLRIG